MIFYSLLFLTAISTGLTYAIRIIALKKSIMDIPNGRSLHSTPTPRGGGFAFVVTFYLALCVLFFQHMISSHVFIAFLSGIPIALIGYLDDMFTINSKWRALVHFISAIWGVCWLGGVPFMQLPGIVIDGPVIFSIISVFMIVWFINFYNFMDGIDGLAGMQAVFVAVAAGSMLYFHSNMGLSYLCFALAASVLGFLFVNWPPAKIFMGDVGSGFLGFVFAMLICVTNNQHSLSMPFWWILIAMFLCDATYTLAYRIRRKEKWYEAHCEHGYQRLVQAGFSHKKVMLGILFINIVLCLPLAIYFTNLHSLSVILTYIVSIAFVAWLAWLLVIKKYPFID